MDNLSSSRFFSLKCTSNTPLDFRPILELDYFLSGMPALQIVASDYFFIKIHDQVYLARKVIGLLDEALIKPYEFIDFKVGELSLVTENVEFLNSEGLIELPKIFPVSNQNYLFTWGLQPKGSRIYGTQNRLYAFKSDLIA